MENKLATNDQDNDLTLEELAEATGGAPRTFSQVRTANIDLKQRVPTGTFDFGALRDPGLVFQPARPRLLDSLPLDLINLVEKL